jgi:predicted nucleic acid-binding protein
MPKESTPKLYLDTSVFLCYFNKPQEADDISLEESQRRQRIVRSILEQSNGGLISLHTSVYSKIEIAFTEEEKQVKKLDEKVPELFDAVLNDEKIVQMISLSYVIADKARAIVRQTQVSNGKVIKPKDAIHVASAMVYKSDKLYTYDKGLILWSGKMDGLVICQPELEQEPIL